MASEKEGTSTQLEEPRMEDQGALLVAGLMKTYTEQKVDEIPLLWQELTSHFGKIPGQVGHKAYGVIYNIKNEAGFAYMAGVEVSTAADVPEELNVIRIPDLTCAVFAHTGHVSTLKNTISSIWNEWLPKTGLRSGKLDDEVPDVLEQYGEGFDPRTGKGDIEVWVPIKNRARMITFEPALQA